MPAHLMATEIIPLIMPAIMLAFLLEKTMEFVLPEHIKFSQSLPGPVAFNLSDSCAQGVTLSELLAFRGELPFDSSLGYNPVAGSDPLKMQYSSIIYAQRTQWRISKWFPLPERKRPFTPPWQACYSQTMK